MTARTIRGWLEATEKAPKLLRSGKAAESRRMVELDTDDPKNLRARQVTANRLLTVLKAALAFAFHEGRAASDEAWRKVMAYREVDAPVVHFLSGPECVRLVNACQGSFHGLVRGAFDIGCRYGELTRMRVSEYHPGRAP